MGKIDQGGMAEIYRAVTHFDGVFRVVALKMILSDHGDDAEFQEMFRSEIKIMIQLSHPNLVQVFDYGQVEGKSYIAMEYIQGQTLSRVFKRVGRDGKILPRALSLQIVQQLARGLNYIHHFEDPISGEAAHIIHRDVSPHNVILAYDGTPKLIDFGMAKGRSNRDLTKTGVIKGKLPYLAPELIAGGHYSPRSDLFALGTLFWELLTGKKLFVGDGVNDYSVLHAIANCQDTVRPPSKLNANVSPELDAVVLRCLERDADKRFQSGAELNEAVVRVLHSEFPQVDENSLKKFMVTDYREERRRESESLVKQVEFLREGLKGGKFSGAEWAHSKSGTFPSKAIMINPNADTAQSNGSGVSLSVAEVKSLFIAESERQRRSFQKLLLMGVAIFSLVVLGAFIWNQSQQQENAGKSGVVRNTWRGPGHIVFRRDGLIVRSVDRLSESFEMPAGSYEVSVYGRSQDPARHGKIRVEKGTVVELAEFEMSRKVAAIQSPFEIPGLLFWFRAENLEAGNQHSLTSDVPALKSQLNQAIQGATAEVTSIQGLHFLDFSSRDAWYPMNELVPYISKAPGFSFVSVSTFRADRVQYLLSCHEVDEESDVLRLGTNGDGKMRMRGNWVFHERDPIVELGPPILMTFTVGGSDVSLFQNGKWAGGGKQDPVFLARVGRCSIGQEYDRSRPSDFFKGKLGDFLIFDHVLTNEERQAVEFVLQQKYRLVSN